jgi:hypothetical protein
MRLRIEKLLCLFSGLVLLSLACSSLASPNPRGTTLPLTAVGRGATTAPTSSNLSKNPPQTQAASPTESNSGPWKVERISSRTDFGGGISFLLDASKVPHIALTVGDGQGGVYVTVREGAWEFEDVDGNAKSFSGSLDVDSTNQLHIAYCSYGCPTAFCFCSALKYASRENGSWNVSVLESGESFLGNGAVLAIDSENSPHIAYYGSASVNYTSRAGTSWSKSTVGFFGLEHWAFPALQLGSDGKPYIAYANPNVIGGDIQFGYFEGGQWEIASIGKGISLSFVLDLRDQPHLLFCDDIGWRHLQYAHRNDNAWPADLLYQDASICVGDLAVDSAGHPHIVYSDFKESKLIYAYFDGAEWQKNAVYDSPASNARIALDADGRPEIVFRTEKTNSLNLAVPR